MLENKPILEIKKLKKYFPITKGFLRKKIGEIKAVDDVNFDLVIKKVLKLI